MNIPTAGPSAPPQEEPVDSDASTALPSMVREVLGAMSLRQVKAFKPHEGQEPSARLTDGGVYYGDLDGQRRPHGRGIALLGDGASRFGGEWREGHYHGFGSMCAPTFDYEGSWEGDEMHGHGTIYYKDTVVSILLRGVQLLSPFDVKHRPLEYRGDFHKTYHRHGIGTMTYRNGDVYEGAWSSNRREGSGAMRYASGERYQGQWSNDERHGDGVMQEVNGAVFRGTFEHDRRHGLRCVLTFPHGDEYTGEFQQDDITGEGTMRYKNGDVYQGAWKDAVRHGKGKFELKKSGATIQGTFVKGLIHGEAEVTFPGKSKYIGNFEKGERTFGTLFNDIDGSVYQGEWRADHMHGLGLQWSANGDFYYGKFVVNKREGFGNCNYVNGDEYSGEFANDMRHGKGILQSTDGSIQAGTWESDVLKRGYQGEWDGVNFNGIGTLHLGLGATQYFGIFRDGLRDGAGILRVSKDMCNQAALQAAAAVPVWRKTIAKNGRPTLLPPQDRGVGDFGMVIFSLWRRDELNGQTIIQYPNGQIFAGRCSQGLRCSSDDRPLSTASLEQGLSHLARIVDPYGHEYIGTLRGDAQDGSIGYFLSKNVAKPLYDPLTPEEEAQELAAAVEASRADAEIQRIQNEMASNSGGTFSFMNPLTIFRGRSNSQLERATAAAAAVKHVERRIVDFENDFVVVGPWTFVDREEFLLQNTIGVAPTKLVPLCGGGLGLEGLPKSARASVLLPPPAVPKYACGTACGSSTFFYENEQVVFQVDLCEGRPLLFVPHKLATPSKVPSPSILNTLPASSAGCSTTSSEPKAEPFPATTIGDPVLDPLKSWWVSTTLSSSDPRNCVHCGKEFGLFRKPLPCDVCRLNKCASCLQEINPISFDGSGVLAALLVSRHFRNEGTTTAAGSAIPFHAKMKIQICPWCISAVTHRMVKGTVWTPKADSDEENVGAAALAITSQSWSVYRGPLAGRKPHGEGEQWHGTTSYFRGMFVLGDRQGHGMQVFPNGESYVGEWHKGKRHGVGRYHCSDGSTLIGTWREGELVDPSYHGDTTADGVRCGRGQAFYPDGSRYNGEWKSDMRHGSGIMQVFSGDIYSGAFERDHFHGIGKLVHASSVFMGSFVAGKKHGRGVERFGDRVVEGLWQNDTLEGLVRIHDTAKEDVYDSFYKNGEERRDMFLPPAMKQDLDAVRCNQCHAEFGFFLRKHHCRLCGHVVCDDCSKHRVVLPLHFNLTPAQRLCTSCSEATIVGQSLGIRRYASGAVYCGLWVNNVWASSGVYCRPGSTEYFLLNSYPSSVSSIATPRLPQSPFDPSQHGQDADLHGPPHTEQEHSHLPHTATLPRATEEDVVRFKRWWTSAVETMCGSASVFPLTFETVHSIELPLWNPTVPLNVFSLKDDEDDTAAARRANFEGRTIPEVPQPPTHLKPPASAFQQPIPLLEETAQLDRITNERIERFMPFPPPSANEGSPVDSSGEVYRKLRCYDKVRFNLDTPPRPPLYTGQLVPWSTWSCYPVPEYRGVGGTYQEPFFKTLPMVPVPDCGIRDLQLEPLDGGQSLQLSLSRSGSVVVTQQSSGGAALQPNLSSVSL